MTDHQNPSYNWQNQPPGPPGIPNARPGKTRLKEYLH